MTGPPNKMLDFMRHSKLPKALSKTFLWLTVRAAMNISNRKQLFTKRLDKHGTRSINHFNNLMQLSRNMSIISII